MGACKNPDKVWEDCKEEICKTAKPISSRFNTPEYALLISDLPPCEALPPEKRGNEGNLYFRIGELIKSNPYCNVVESPPLYRQDFMRWNLEKNVDARLMIIEVRRKN